MVNFCGWQPTTKKTGSPASCALDEEAKSLTHTQGRRQASALGRSLTCRVADTAVKGLCLVTQRSQPHPTLQTRTSNSYLSARYQKVEGAEHRAFGSRFYPVITDSMALPGKHSCLHSRWPQTTCTGNPLPCGRRLGASLEETSGVGTAGAPETPYPPESFPSPLSMFPSLDLITNTARLVGTLPWSQ